MTRRGRPRLYDRDEVLDQALLLFWRNGYDATSMSALLEAAGLSSASFYHAFGSKRDVFDAAIERYASTFGAVFEPLSDERLPPRQAVETTLLGSIRMQTDVAHPRGCLVTLSGVIIGEDAGGESAVRLRAATRSFYRQRVDQAMASGQLGGDTDAESLSTVLECFQWGLSIDARDGVTVDALVLAAREVMSLWDSHT